ncbi:hypothetical protein MMC07_008954 [Pseudocyphellaria aurata]|nr:hypothetical protein [Pseudocyphellaria aurata]
MTSTPIFETASSHHGRWLRKLLRPDGRRVHIAGSPEEHERLRRTLSTVEPDGQFDVYIHGSDEHLEVVREIHAHHEQRRRELQQTHGHLYEDFENVHTQLSALATELHLLSEHGVALDANFSKYGYSAHLRTREPDSSANSAVTPSHDTNEKRDWNAELRSGKALKFWKKPVVRQYFHKGLLWRASDIEEVASFELFVDLLYVGIIAIVGDNAAEHPTGKGLLEFAITFAIGWKMWTDLTLVISWFDDIFQRLWVMFEMICLFGYTLNIANSFETTWAQLIAFFLAQRLFAASYYLWIAYTLPMVRGYMLANTILVVIPSALWIASIHTDYPSRLGYIFVALWLDHYGMVLIIASQRNAKKFPAKLAAAFARWFEFFPAVNIEHKTERTNAFVTLVFGYSVVALLFQNRAAYGINAFFGKAVLGLIQAFCFNWLYFEIATVWISTHLPFIMGYVIAGASLSKLVLAHDSGDTDVETLGEVYLERSEPEVPIGLRWFYCGGLGIALLCMSAISMSHIHKEFEGQRIAKRYRLAVRVAIAIVLICLPLAHGLSSLELISTTTALVALILTVDLYGSTSVLDDFWRDKKMCKYSAECHLKKKDIETAFTKGETIAVEKLSKGNEGEKCLFEMS